MSFRNFRTSTWRYALLLLPLLAVIACSNKAERYAHHLARGQEFVKEGKDIKATLEFKTALQSNPAGTEANYQLGMIAERLNDWPAARAFFTKVTDQDPKHVPALLEEGRISLMGEDADGALQIAQKCVALAPQNSMAHALRGAALLRKDRLADAEAEANASLKLKAQNAPAIAVLAGIRSRQGLPDQAVEILDNGIKANPNDEGLLLAKLKILDDQGNRADAEKTLTLLVDREPKVLAYRLDLARRLIGDQRIDAAEAVMRKGVASSPNDTASELALVKFLKELRGNEAAEKELSARVAADPKKSDLKLFLSELYFADGKKEQARQTLSDLIAQGTTKQNELAARTALARFAITDGKSDEAQAELTKILAQDPTNANALLLKAELSASAKDYPTAVAQLRTALKGSPNSKPALVALARTYIQMGEADLGADFYQRALDSDPADLNLRIEFAERLLASGKPSEADDQARLAIASSPSFEPALLVHASALAAQSKWTEAETIAKQLVESPTAGAQAHFLLGRIYTVSKQYPMAVAELKQALVLAPTNFAIKRALAAAYAGSGDGAGGTQFVQSLIDASPQDAQEYQLLGELKTALGASDEARAAFEQSLKLNPRSVDVRLELGNLLTSHGDNQLAANVLAEGVKLAPANTDLQFASGFAEDRLDHFAAARTAYEAVLKQQPHNVAAANNLAGLIADAWPADKTLLEEARRLAEPNRNSTNPALVDTLGWVQYRLGNLDDALALLGAATKSDPKNAAIHYHLGIALLGAGRKKEAHGELEQAVATNAPYRGFDDARRALSSD